MGGKIWDAAQKGDFDQYFKTMALPQVKEIVARFQALDYLVGHPGRDDSRTR